jgi:hypothetical protein
MVPLQQAAPRLYIWLERSTLPCVCVLLLSWLLLLFCRATVPPQVHLSEGRTQQNSEEAIGTDGQFGGPVYLRPLSGLMRATKSLYKRATQLTLPYLVRLC